MEENMKIRTPLIWLILLSGLLFAPPVAMAKKRGGEGDTEGHRRKGVELIDAKQYDQAIAEPNKEVQAPSAHPEAYRDRGTPYRAPAPPAEPARDHAGPPANH